MHMIKTFIIALFPFYASAQVHKYPTVNNWPNDCTPATTHTYGKADFDISISPSITMVSAWQDAKGIAAAGVHLELDHAVRSDWVLGDNQTLKVDARDVVSINNFVGGNNGIVKKAGFLYDSVRRFRSVVSFIGDYAIGIDGSNFPFDDQHINFTLKIPADTWGYYHSLALFCRKGDPFPAGGKCTAYNQHGQEVVDTDPYGTMKHGNANGVFGTLPDRHNNIVYKTVLEIDKKWKGFTWHQLTCVLGKVSKYPAQGKSGIKVCPVQTEIECSMTGRRAWEKEIKSRMLPGVYMIFIGYGSFCIPSKLAMPRVATTMIALLVFMNYMVAAMNGLPNVGTSIVLYFYTVGAVCLLVNLFGHIMTFRFPPLGDITGDFMGCIVAPSFFVSIAGFMVGKDYPGFPSKALTVVFLIVSLLCLFIGIAAFLIQQRHAFRNCRSLFAKDDDARDEPEAITPKRAVPNQSDPQDAFESAIPIGQEPQSLGEKCTV